MRLDEEDIRNYEQRKFFDRPEKQPLDGVTIFMAVLGAILAAWFLKAMYERWEMNQAMAALNEQMKVIDAQSQAQIQRWKEQSQIKQEEARLKAQAEQNRIADEIENNRIQIGLTQAESARKERAWKAYYKPIIECGDGKGTSIVLCGNDHIKARRDFERLWLEHNK